ncbi:MAG: Imm1 family immunity protein [Myxococcota bacterium]
MELAGFTSRGRPRLVERGGQEGDHPAAQVVDFESARLAARTFFAKQRLEPSLRWEKQ